MSLVATCACGKSFKAKPELAGKRVKCPACGKALQVPAAATTDPAAEPAADDPLGLGSLSSAEAAASPLGPSAASPLMTTPVQATRAKADAGLPRWVPLAAGIGGGVIVLGLVAWFGIQAILSAVRNAPPTAQKTEAPPPAPPAPAPAKPADTWVTYKSPAGGYTVQLPAQPVESRQDAPLGGLTVTTIIVTLDQSPKGAYTTVHADMPVVNVELNPQLALQGGWDAMLRQMTVQKSEVRDMTVNGLPAREGDLEGVVQGRPFSAKLRAIASSKRLYALMWIGPQGTRPEEDLKRFFGSYELTDAAPAPPSTPPAGTNLTDLFGLAPDGKTRPLRQLAQMSEDDRKAAYRLIVMQEKLYRKVAAGTEGLAKTGDKANDELMQGLLKTTDENVWTQIGRFVNLSKEDAQAVKKEGDAKQWPSGP